VSRTCQFAFEGRSGPAGWSFDEVDLVVSPADGRPLVFPVKEMAGIAGDGYTIELTLPGLTGQSTGAPAPAAPAAQAAAPALTLSKLGAEGPTLLDLLQRTWLVERAKALRLGGSGEGKLFSGLVAGLDAPGAGGSGAGGTGAGAPDAARDAAGIPPGAAEPFRALLFEDVMVIAREGRDLDPVFMALTEKITFDDASYAIHATEWPGREIVLSKLGKQTAEFLDSLDKRRQALADEASAILASAAPSLSSGHRGILAGYWPPGRLRTVQDLDSICPGFEQAFRTTWLANCVRKDEGQFLLEWAGPAACWLGCSRETAESGEPLLWALAQKSGTWFLEALTGEDRATYHFAASGEMPALASRLLCAPQFSKEALYGPPEMLTGERAELAIAAQFLGFLAALRAAFRGRVIHTSPESWRTDVEAAASGTAAGG
jgi:hypothetical protein